MSYSIKELNELLLCQSKRIVSQFDVIEIKGDIVLERVFKNNCGVSFKICNGKDSFPCKMWANNGDINIIKDNENMNCKNISQIRIKC